MCRYFSWGEEQTWQEKGGQFNYYLIIDAANYAPVIRDDRIYSFIFFFF